MNLASRVVRLLPVVALISLSQCGTPVAHAVSPPPIEDKWLPEPGLPAPPRPAVQREVCAVVTAEPGLGRDQLAGLDLPQVWQLTRGAGQRVAVIDTGVAPHRRLPKVVAGGDYVSTGDGTRDCDAHGTAVAGIIAAAPDSEAGNYSGVAPEATLISIRQSSAKFAPASDRSGIGFGDVDTMAKAVRTAADLGASLINISSVACVAVSSALDDRALGAALAYAVDVKNAVVVAAAGNTAGNTGGNTGGGAAQCPPQRSGATWDTVTVVVSPAWYDDYVLTVGSVNADGAPAAFTLAGPWVDVAAAPLSGTSYAAPVVSGLAALIRARFPALTARQVVQRIESTAHHPPAGWDPFVGNGTVDALAAVSTDSTPPPTAPTTTAQPAQLPVPPTQAPPSGTPDHARDTALGGAAICLVVLVAAMATAAAAQRLGRLGRSRRGDDVPGD